MEKSRDALRNISEVAEWLGVPTHVLRFWESQFSQIRPVKRAGRRRYYRPADMALLGGIRKLLHDDGMTIRGAQKVLREKGVSAVAALAPPIDQSGKETGASIPVSGDQAEPLSARNERPASPEGQTEFEATGTQTSDVPTPGAADLSEPTAIQSLNRSGDEGPQASELPPADALSPDDEAAQTPSESPDSLQPGGDDPETQETASLEKETLPSFHRLYDRLLALRERMDSTDLRSGER